MIQLRRSHALLLVAFFATFCAGIVLGGWLRTPRAPTLPPVTAELSRTPTSSTATSALPASPTVAVAPLPEPIATASLTEVLAAAASSTVPVIVAAPPPVATPDRAADAPARLAEPAAPTATIALPPKQRLRVPIDGVSIESFKGGFAEMRGALVHEAVDILVPRGTPIHAVRDGTIAKLFVSRLGGLTIYHFEDGGRLCFYYAHLERYADGLHEGQRVSQGEVIGYVGTSGNAPPDTPHLHFAISRLNEDRKWWQGRALDPYLVFKDQGVQ